MARVICEILRTDLIRRRISRGLATIDFSSRDGVYSAARRPSIGPLPPWLLLEPLPTASLS
jgi:hypothetical protein